jgi:hypothetical protein
MTTVLCTNSADTSAMMNRCYLVVKHTTAEEVTVCKRESLEGFKKCYCLEDNRLFDWIPEWKGGGVVFTADVAAFRTVPSPTL